jgi:hypothetical protein
VVGDDFFYFVGLVIDYCFCFCLFADLYFLIKLFILFLLGAFIALSDLSHKSSFFHFLKCSHNIFAFVVLFGAIDIAVGFASSDVHRGEDVVSPDLVDHHLKRHLILEYLFLRFGGR